jgi:Acetyltransferase (GNAT) domain
MQLVLERCTIRPWRLNDAESLVRHANNRKVWRALRDAFPHPYTVKDAHEFLEAAVNSVLRTLFCIEVNGAVVGGIGIRPGIDVHRHTAELGYWLSEEFWGGGIMSEAVGAFTDFCFQFFAAANLRRAVREQCSVCARAGKSRLHLRRTPQEQRPQRWRASRFPALRPDKVASREPATCVSVDHRRYGSPQQTNDFIYRSRLQRRARTFGYPGCDSGGRVWRDTAVRDHRR